MPLPSPRRSLCMLLAACLTALPTAVRAQSGPDAPAPVDVDVPPTSELALRVTDDAGQPLSGVTVVLGTLEGEEVLRLTTDRQGEGSIEEIRHGYYQLAFQRDGKAYLANRVILLEPEEEHELTFRLGSFTAREKDLGLAAGQQVPLLGEPATGVAKLAEAFEPTGWAWFRTGKGVTVLIGSAALLVGGIVALSDDEDERSVSPSQP